jgi:ribonuclease HII
VILNKKIVKNADPSIIFFYYWRSKIKTIFDKATIIVDKYVNNLHEYQQFCFREFSYSITNGFLFSPETAYFTQFIILMLKPYIYKNQLEAGCDEAGRGCLAGPVFAAAVILPRNYKNEILNDSKKLTEKKRLLLRDDIIRSALAWNVASVDNVEIDEINILRASIKAMHLALEGLAKQPEFILVDGNRFFPYKALKHKTIIRGDGIYMSIAAASVLAKTFRDEFMEKIHSEYPVYGWKNNKGYTTRDHRNAIVKHGISPYHRKSFSLTNTQMTFDFS